MMTRIAATLGLLFGLAATPAWASAEDPAGAPRLAAAEAPSFGQALPPVGFIAFCARHPESCEAGGTGPLRPRLELKQWQMVSQVNSYVNADVAPATDEEIYGEAEHWDYPGRRGDCEDYALLKQRYLEILGLPRAALLLTVVLDEHREGHAVLTLATSEGDFILDNRRNIIRRWRDSDYIFLKRQSERDPRRWVALTREAPGVTTTLAWRGSRIE